jgi:hypothetical protein
MSNDRPKREPMTTEEEIILTTLRLAALIEEQERLLKYIREGRRRDQQERLQILKGSELVWIPSSDLEPSR